MPKAPIEMSADEIFIELERLLDDPDTNVMAIGNAIKYLRDRFAWRRKQEAMTMKIKIKNEDTEKSRAVKVLVHDHANNGESTLGDTRELGPGEETELWIHGTRSLSVHEVLKQ